MVKAKKKDTSVRRSQGRLDDAAHAVILVLWSLLDLCGHHLWTIGGIAAKVNCDWVTVRRAIANRTPPRVTGRRRHHLASPLPQEPPLPFAGDVYTTSLPSK